MNRRQLIVGAVAVPVAAALPATVPDVAAASVIDGVAPASGDLLYVYPGIKMEWQGIIWVDSDYDDSVPRKTIRKRRHRTRA